ncbi:MAG: hypothetical protein ABUL58_01650, partial [Steroidobacter sp.]
MKVLLRMVFTLLFKILAIAIGMNCSALLGLAGIDFLFGDRFVGLMALAKRLRYGVPLFVIMVVLYIAI